MPYADELDTSSAISSMADDLDQQADAVSQGLSGGSSMGVGPGNIAGEQNPIASGYDASQVTIGPDATGPSIEEDAGYENITSLSDKSPYGADPNAAAMMGGGPSTDTMPQSIYGTPGGEAPDVTNLGDRPSLEALQAAIDSGGDPSMGGGPSDMIASLMGEEEVAEEVAPGEEVATFLSDFNRGMSASPVGTISQGEAQESLLTDPQAQASIDAGIPGSLRNRNIQSQMGGGPSDLHEAPLGSYDYQAGVINEPAPKSTMERLYESITNLGGSQMGAGGPDVPGMLRHDAGYDVVRDPHSTTMGTPNPAYLAAQSGPDIPGVTSFEGTPVDQVVASGGAVAPQDIAPKYSGTTVTVETQDQMYPGHKNFATKAGVSSILSTTDGSHAGWIAAVNEDMVARGIELTHEINGVKTGNHSSADWKEYSALFDPETGLDSNGVPMPGTAGAPVEEVAVQQGALSPLETGANTFGEVYDDVRAAPVGGDDTRGDNPIDIIRSTYTWASSLPNNVLFNAARYPDYLRLLIEYDAAGKDLPLEIPTWILEGTARPAEDDEEQAANWISNHPAMQTQELFVGT